VADQIRQYRPDVEVEIKVIKTTGDKLTTASLAALASDTKGLFVKEIEEALLQRVIDLAVHSMKDLPTELPDGLSLCLVPDREDPADALIAPQPLLSLRELPEGGKIATSSLRREVQLRCLRPDLEILPIRGNVDTRLRKLKEQKLDGILLAVAGLKRLGLAERISYRFPVDEMIPAVGQGALALEAREGDEAVKSLIGALEHQPTHLAILAERHFLALIGGGCQVPLGAHAQLEGDRATFSALIASPSKSKIIRKTLSGRTSELENMVGETAEYFRSNGANQILKEVGL
jgi:hydroxymethylbilane synthase